MARSDRAGELKKLIAQLQSERQQHVEAIEEIDRTFSELGIDAEMAPRRRGPGRPAGRRGGRRTKAAKTGKKATKAGRRRRRGRFARSGEDSVVSFVKSKGNPSTAEVNQHWKSEGRAGKADNTLTRLVQQKKLKRQKIKGERGSRYQAA